MSSCPRPDSLAAAQPAAVQRAAAEAPRRHRVAPLHAGEPPRGLARRVCVAICVGFCAAFLGIGGGPAYADDLLLDRGRLVEGLWVYPSRSEPSRWRYVPDHAELARDGQGRPQFALTFYVSERAGAGEETSATSVVEADGGGLLHFIVQYGTDPEQVEAAQTALREMTGDDEAEIVGPIMFDDGRYSVVTSIVEEGEDGERPALLAQRSAPLMEGNRLPITARLTAEQAAMLLGSMRTATPDLSVVFEMTFSGLSQAFDAVMIVDWEKTREALQASAGGSVYFVSADVEAVIDEAMQNGGIELRVSGDNANMEALVEMVHARALDMMFAPIEVEEVPGEARGDLLDALAGIVAPGGALSSGNTTGFGAHMGYRVKDLRREGETRLSFNKRARLERRAVLTVNLSEAADLSVDDPETVQYVSTVDPATRLRRVYVSVDGELERELGGFVNAVTVTLRKDHPGDRETVRELFVRPEAQETASVHGPLTYSNVEREDEESWLSYRYKSDWSFQGGGRFRSDWHVSEAAMITLTAPYHHHDVFIEGETDPLIDAGVRAVIAEVSADFFGDRQSERRIIRPESAGETLAVEPISLTLPAGDFAYDWTIVWALDDGTRRTRSGRDDLGFLFVDELPSPPDEIDTAPTQEEEDR